MHGETHALFLILRHKILIKKLIRANLKMMRRENTVACTCSVDASSESTAMLAEVGLSGNHVIKEAD